MQSSPRVHPALVTLHWLMAALLALAAAGMYLRGALPSGHPWRPALRHSHLFIGELAFWLVLLRLGMRWRHPVKPAAGVPRWSRRAALVSHGLLYVLFVAQPVLGVLMQQTGGKDVEFLGLVLPRLMQPDVPAHFELKEAHTLTSFAFAALLVLHVSAALWHHLVRQDSTLRDMTSWRRTSAHRRSPDVSALHHGTEAPDATPQPGVAIAHAGLSATQTATQDPTCRRAGSRPIGSAAGRPAGTRTPTHS